MSSGGGKSGNEVTEESIPDWIRFPAIRNLQRAEDVQRIEYMPYRGAEVAGFTDNQIAAFQNNNNAATAFGLQAPTNAMSGMPTPELYANGMRGYSSMPLYDQALAETKKAQPDAVAQYDSLFGSNVGTTYNPYPTGSPNSSSGGGGNNAVDPNMLAIQKLRDDRDNAVIPPVNYNTSGSGSNPFGYLDDVPNSPGFEDIAEPSNIDYNAIVAEMKQKQMENAMSAYGNRTGVDTRSPGHPSFGNYPMGK